MAHDNINEREYAVKLAINRFGKLTPEMRRNLANYFKCSLSAIYRDVAVVQSKVIHGIFPSKNMKADIFERDGNVCQYCLKKMIKKKLIIEHIVPCSIGGVASYDNLVVACYSCNMLKRNKVWGPNNFDSISVIDGHKQRVLSLQSKDCRNLPKNVFCK